MGSNRNILRNNRIYNNQGVGAIASVDGQDNQIYNNLVYNNNGDGIMISPVGGAPPNADRNLVYNNTFYKNTGNCMAVGGWGPSDSNQLINNICYSNGADLVYLWSGATHTTMQTNLLGVDPKFNNAANGDFSLTGQSTAAIDKGTSIPLVTVDFTGITTRPQLTGYDIGAYELSAGTPSPLNTRLPQSSLSIQSTTSNTNPGAAIDSDSTTRWSTDPDPLPQTIIFNLGASHFVTGVRAEETWTPIGGYAIYVSSDGVNWGAAMSSGPPDLPNNSDLLFTAGKTGRYLKLVVQSGANGVGYDYLTDFWVLVNDGSAFSPCDLNSDGSTIVSDVQLCVNQAIGIPACIPAGQAGSGDVNHDGHCNVLDVQRVANAVLTGVCNTP